MLINEAARNLYDEMSPRWAELETWVKDAAHPERVAHLHQLDSYFKRWHEIDNGRWLSDPNDIDTASRDLEVAENNAADLGYPLPSGHGKRTTTTTEIVDAGEGIHEVTGLPTTVADQEAVVDVTSKIPIVRTLTSPKDLSWCQRLDMPDAICGKDGLHMPDDKTPLYILGGGLVALFLGGAYVSYKAAQVAAPIALRFAAPELAPHFEKFQAERAAGRSGRQHIEDTLAELAAGQRGVAQPTRPRTLGDLANDSEVTNINDIPYYRWLSSVHEVISPKGGRAVDALLDSDRAMRAAWLRGKDPYEWAEAFLKQHAGG